MDVRVRLYSRDGAGNVERCGIYETSTLERVDMDNKRRDAPPSISIGPGMV